MGRILFLDDMKARHEEFDRISEGHDVTHVYNAIEAIYALDAAIADGRPYEQVFLDHDLSYHDIMIPVGAPSREPTGMVVADHIVAMDVPPAEVVIHSHNPDAAREMVRRISDRWPEINVKRVAFAELIAQRGAYR